MKLDALHITAIAFLGLTACGSGSDRVDERAGGLVKAPVETVETVSAQRAASDPAELRRALMLPHHQLADALGAHQFRGSSKLRVSRGDEQVEALDDETLIDCDAAGQYHARLDNSREYGRDVYYVGGQLYLRPRYGKYHRRAPTDDREPARIGDEVYATLGDYYDLVSHAAKPVDRGATTERGRPGRRIAIELAGSPRPRVERATEKKWRETAVVERIAGEVVLDDATGAVLTGALQAQVAFMRDGSRYTMALEVTHSLDAIGGDVAVAAPPDDQTVDTIVRSHELEERDALLEGIAAPARKVRAQ